MTLYKIKNTSTSQTKATVAVIINTEVAVILELPTTLHKKVFYVEN